jgi:hypothetical protein
MMPHQSAIRRIKKLSIKVMQIVSATLTREFYCFALACGFAPQSVVGSFIDLAEEYGQAHCDHRGNLVWQDAVAWRETGRDNGTSSTQQSAV